MEATIYYTQHCINERRRPFMKVVRRLIEESGLHITSCSRIPMDFGDNVVLDAPSGPVTMFRQILMALEHAKEKYIFFCEHDVLYHKNHFDYTPPTDDAFYYNTNVWRWDYASRRCITYDNLISVSGICVNRKLAIEFYKKRLELIYKRGYDKIETMGNPRWANAIGWEPGKVSFKGRYDMGEVATTITRRSAFPNVDIRHTRTISAPKMHIEDFKSLPTNWQESTINNLPGWENFPWNSL